MKKTIIAIALAAIIPAAVFAAGPSHGHGHRGPNVERMAERLDLTPEQQERVRVLLEANRAERESMRERMRTSMAEILTPEQQARMAELREDRREHRKERHGRGKGRRQGGECEDQSKQS